MLNEKEIKKVKKAIDEKFGGSTTIKTDDILKMDYISKINDAISILAGQFGDLTILVWTENSKKGFTVRSVKVQAW